MKRCPTCGEEKPLEAFCKNRRKKDGLQFACRACSSTSFAAWRGANPEKAQASRDAWREENPREDDRSKRYHATRALAIADRGGRCIHCGKTEEDFQKGSPTHQIKLHFHHTGVKHYTIADQLIRGWDFVRDEVALTVLLCSGCHIKEHKRRAAKARETLLVQNIIEERQIA